MIPIYWETLTEFFDRKQHLLFLLISLPSLILIYLGVNKKLDLVNNNIATPSALMEFSADSLNTFVTLLVLFSVVSTILLFTKLTRKGRVEFYLSKPITRNYLLYSKLISVYVIYAVSIIVLSVLAAALLYFLGALSIESVIYIMPVSLISLAIWMCVTSYIGMQTKSTSFTIVSSFVIWVSQFVLVKRIDWSIEQDLVRYLIDAVYYILPNTTEMGKIGLQLAAGATITNWLPLFTTVLLASILLYTISHSFNRRDF